MAALNQTLKGDFFWCGKEEVDQLIAGRSKKLTGRSMETLKEQSPVIDKIHETGVQNVPGIKEVKFDISVVNRDYY